MPGHQAPPEVVQGALHRGKAGPNQQRAGLRGALQLSVPLQEQEQIWEERLEPLGAQVVGRPPADLERAAELRPIPSSPWCPMPPRQSPAAPLEQRYGIAEVVPGGQAEGVQDLAPLLAPRPSVPGHQLGRQLVPLSDPHGPPSRRRDHGEGPGQIP